MSDTVVRQPKDAAQSPAVRWVLILVTVTFALSLLYAIQYYLGGPIRLSVVSPFGGLSVSGNGALVAAGAQDGRVFVWEVPSDLRTTVPADFDISTEPRWPVQVLRGHRSAIVQVAFAPDQPTLVTVDRAGQVRRWQPAIDTRSEVLVSLDDGELVDADLSPDLERLAAVDAEGVVHIWDLKEGVRIQEIDAGDEASNAVAISDDGMLVAAANGANIGVWDVESGALVQTMEGRWKDPETEDTWLGHDETVTALAFSPDAALLASGSADTTIMFWNVETGEVQWPSEGHWAAVTTLTFDPTGDYILTGGRDNKVRTIRVAGGKSTATYEGHLSPVRIAIYGPLEGTLLSAGNDGTVRLWESTNQKLLHIEWSRYGFQPTWGAVLAAWLLLSGVSGLVALWGLRSYRTWSHLFALLLYLVGPIIVIGLPLFEVLSYPLQLGTKLSIAWPLIGLGLWYIFLLVMLMREPVLVCYEAPHKASLSQQLVISQRTARTRLGVFGLAVWIGLLVVLYSVLRRFNLDIAFMGHFLPFIMGGAGLTVLVSALSILLAVVLALLGALGRLSNNPIPNGIASFYISLIRGTPLLVQIFIWYLGLPQLGIILRPLAAGILALGVNYGAYMTETFRAGIQAISKGQREAAQALGMTSSQTFRRIIIPQAFRIVIPPIGNDFIAMMKDSSLVYLMGVWELTFRAQKIGRQNFRTMETFIIAAAFYWLLTVIFQFLQGKLEDYMARSERR
ncbi:MAG: ABC transporter permease subunit [Anaerolineae bacterium]|nr:ABC transporter permease subunit [Anaerolineae bacterium]